MKRRHFIKAFALAAAAPSLLESCRKPRVISGLIIGPSSSFAHKLRDRKPQEPEYHYKKKYVVVGAGVSGLSAAYHLSRKGVVDLEVIDLEDEPGGNARSGRNEVSAYPWGAHYVPIPNPGLDQYLGFLQEAGVITGYDTKGKPYFNEYYLCSEPEERLYINGKWQEGLVPDFGLPDEDKEQIRNFLALMDEMRYAKGQDGKYAFAIPVDSSSDDARFAELDDLTMQQWLEKNGYTSSYLKTYIDYCTRDDFGTSVGMISAWAGIHYFAGRKGVAANAEPQDVLTWPEGNGFLVAEMKKKISRNIRTGALVTSVQVHDGKVLVDHLDAKTGKLSRVSAEKCIIATPQFVAARILKDPLRSTKVKASMHYTPWLVANCKVAVLEQRSGVEACWDNVIHGSASLGYVDATHNLVEQHLPFRNITYYLPFTEGLPSKERERLSSITHREWVEHIINELSPVHPNIRDAIQHCDVMLWGHSMCQPRPGMIKGRLREELSTPIEGKIFFAHTDLAGISIFEEAFYQGLHAVEKMLSS